MDIWAREMKWDAPVLDWNMLTMDPGRIEIPGSGTLLITEIFSCLTGSLPWRAFLEIRQKASVGREFVPVRGRVLPHAHPCFVLADYTSGEFNRCLGADWNDASFILLASENPLSDEELMDVVSRHEKEELGHRPMPGKLIAATGHDNSYWLCLHRQSNEMAIRLIKTVCNKYGIDCRSR